VSTSITLIRCQTGRPFNVLNVFNREYIDFAQGVASSAAWLSALRVWAADHDVRSIKFLYYTSEAIQQKAQRPYQRTAATIMCSGYVRHDRSLVGQLTLGGSNEFSKM